MCCSRTCTVGAIGSSSWDKSSSQALLVFCKELFFLITVIVSVSFWIFLWNVENYKPLTTEYYRQYRAETMNANEFSPLGLERVGSTTEGSTGHSFVQFPTR